MAESMDLTGGLLFVTSHALALGASRLLGMPKPVAYRGETPRRVPA